MPLVEPTCIEVKVPAYQAERHLRWTCMSQGLQTKRKAGHVGRRSVCEVWKGRELLQAFCPQISITWVNLHASEVTVSVFARLYRRLSLSF